MPYVLFWTTIEGRDKDFVPKLRDDYRIFRDSDPIMLEADKLAKREDVNSWGVAKIEAASEPQWTDNKLL